ncbi:general amidase [Apiospora hydei]|uniref:General amidase n=1 Tax=Apiospora hydei TaxID=1337664 RepID=A0ABR1WZA1_9PEZI
MHFAEQLRLRRAWKEVVAGRRAQQGQTVRTWAERTLGTAVPRLPDGSVTNVVDWPRMSGQLSARQLEITESMPSQLLGKMATGTWTAQEVLLSFIARTILAHHLTNPLTDPMFDRGLRRAADLDDFLREKGHPVGPLHGLPISLKDAMNVEGMPTTLGFVARADAKPPHSDELVSRLSAAGAVFYCKTNVPQSLMSGEGSSGGEGSLVALGGSPLGIGTDIAGSIRTPANFNGTFGLCPTYGRFPCHDAEQSSAGYMLNGVAGPLSRSIDGLEVYTKSLLSLKSREWDPTCERLPWNEATYQDTLRSGLSGGDGLCIGFVANDGVTTPHPPIQRGMREAREALQRFGVRVVDVQLFDGTEDMWKMMTKMFNSTGGSDFRDLVRQSGEPISEEIELAAPEDALSASKLFQLGRQILELRHRILRRRQDTLSITGTGRPVDLFVLPSGCTVAPPHGTMKYWLYEAISNLLDWTCATIPVGHVTSTKDPKPDMDDDFKPLSSFDRYNWDLLSSSLLVVQSSR